MKKQSHIFTKLAGKKHRAFNVLASIIVKKQWYFLWINGSEKYNCFVHQAFLKKLYLDLLFWCNALAVTFILFPFFDIPALKYFHIYVVTM